MDSRLTAAVCAAGIGLAIFASPWAASAETTDSGSTSESTTSRASSDSDATTKSTARRSDSETTATSEPDDDISDDERKASDEAEDIEKAQSEGADEGSEPDAEDATDPQDPEPAETVSHDLATPSAELAATTVPAAPAQPANPVVEAVWALARRTEAQAESDETPVVPPIVDATTDTLDVGNGPSSVALSPDGTLAYVTDLDSGSVSVIYLATGEVISTIDVGAAPSAVALGRDGERAYTANPNLGTVSVIDTATAEVIESVAVGASPSSLAVSPTTARLYVANLGDETVSAIDTRTNVVIATITVGTSPSALLVSSTGRRLYVTNYESGTVSVISTALNRVIGTIRVGGNPGAIALSPNGRRAYVADSTGGTVSVVSTFFQTVISDSPIYVSGSPDAIAVSPDGERVYVANLADNTISVIDADSSLAFVRLAAGQGPSGIALSPDGTTAYVTNSIDGTVSVIDTTKVPDAPAEPTPVGRTSTEGFTVFNVTGKPITFLGYYFSDERPENGGPGIGTVIPPGGTIRFEVIYNFLRTTRVYPRFEIGPGQYWDVVMTVGGVRQTRSSCTAPGSTLQCKITSDIPGDEKFISLLDSPGTEATVDKAQEQAQLLNAFCREASLGKCTFKVVGDEIEILGPVHQVGNTIRNPITNPTPLTKTLTLADAVTNSDSVTVTAKVSIAFLDKLVNAEITQAYGHTWTNTRTFTESYTITVPPGYEGKIVAQQPLWRAYGNFRIVAGNTVLTLTNVYFDTPNTDPNANGVYEARITEIDPLV